MQFITPPPATATSGLALTPQPSIRLLDAAGASVPGQFITASASPGTLSGATAGPTNTDGFAAFKDLTLTANGTVALTFSAPGAVPLTASIVMKPEARFVVTATNLTPKPSESVQITAQLVDASGKPVLKSTPVRWLPDPGPWRERSQSTDDKGVATGTFVATGQQVTITVIDATDSRIQGSVTLNALGLDLSLSSSSDASRRQNGNELRRGLRGETRIGAELQQRRD
jgi:hypothetical protein